MNKQNVNGGQVIHLDISKHCSHKPKERRELIFECHLHKAIWWQRFQLAWTLILGKPIHLKMGGECFRIGDRLVTEIEL